MAELNANNGNFTAGNENNSEFQQSPAYPGSWQQILKDNIGEYCLIDFLIGTQNLVRREGVLYAVGVSVLTLIEPKTEIYIVCDLYSIKFVTFPSAGLLPAAKNIRKRV